MIIAAGGSVAALVRLPLFFLATHSLNSHREFPPGVQRVRIYFSGLRVTPPDQPLRRRKGTKRRFPGPTRSETAGLRTSRPARPS